MVIVTTTINPPTEAIERYARLCVKKGWHLIIVGDQKTPHEAYVAFANRYFGHVWYLGPDEQNARWPKLSELIGWNCIQRRSIGLLDALNYDGDVIATVDDDNIPYDDWGMDVVLGQEQACVECITELPLFEPLSMTNYPHLWHRGFPIQWIWDRPVRGNTDWVGRNILVRADLWDGDPDVDAICRMTYRPHVRFDVYDLICGNVMSPFNSQNTFLHRKVIPYYFMFPGIGRMDDIWASFWVQHNFPGSVVYGPASVYQVRNTHDPLKDMAAEALGREKTHLLVEDMGNFMSYIPYQARAAYDEYHRIAEGLL